MIRKLCDLCTKPLMPEFSDKGYKVTIQKLEHSYDGYNPWLRKTNLDICERCMSKIIKANPKQETSK